MVQGQSNLDHHIKVSSLFHCHNPCHTYNINGHILAMVEEEKDLRIYISNCCSPCKCVTAAAQKANQVLGQLLPIVTNTPLSNYSKCKSDLSLNIVVQCGHSGFRKTKISYRRYRKRVNAVSKLSKSYHDELVQL